MRVVEEVAQHLAGVHVGHPLRVGIDGICGAGKTTFATALADAVRRAGRPVIRLDSDGFHHVRQRRYRQGRDSARGYFEDAYDFTSLASRVLLPLGPDGTLHYAVRVHDPHTDDEITDETAIAPADAVVVFDATFIQVAELRGLWDSVIYLHADEAAATARGVQRDAAALGGRDAARAAYDARYMAACRIYLAECDPSASASIVIDNTDPAAARLIRLS